MSFIAINPATEEVVAEFDGHTPEQVERALDHASAAFRTWKNTPVAERAVLMNRAAELLESEIPVVGEMLSHAGSPFAVHE